MSNTFFRVEIEVAIGPLRAVYIEPSGLKSGAWNSKGQNRDGKVGVFKLVETEVVLTCKKEKRMERWSNVCEREKSLGFHLDGRY
jgi:hypothetical protein